MAINTKTRLICTGIVIGAASALAASHAVSSQDMDDMSPEMMQEMMQKMQQLGSPSEAHQKLDFFVGEWDVETSMMGAPTTHGTCTTKWVLDGRFLHSEQTGSMMGMPYTGWGLNGYDNYKNKYTSFWADNMNTAMYFSQGTASQDGKTITYFGEMDEWMTDEHDKIAKYVQRIVDDNTYTFEIHDPSIVPGETKVIEMTYTRKKDNKNGR